MPYGHNFLSLVFHPREHTNPNILMGAKQWVRALLLWRLSGPYVFDSLRTNQKIISKIENQKSKIIIIVIKKFILTIINHPATHNIYYHPTDLSVPV